MSRNGEYENTFLIFKKKPKKFRRYARMSLQTFNYILEKLKPTLLKNWNNLHKNPIYAEQRLAITLKFLATGDHYNNLASSFMTGDSTVSEILHETMEQLWDVFQPLHMPVPTSQSFLDISNGFYDEWSIPHCIGSIDGKHFRIKKPAHSGSLFYNYKKYFSMVLQAVVDAKKRFIVIDVAKYGSMSDAGIFRVSLLKKDIVTGLLELPSPSKFPNSNVESPYYLIGDGAYPLKPYLMKPYGKRILSPEESTYNRRFSRARCIVENAFGAIAQKWQILHTTMQHSPETVEKIIRCICVLHNILLDIENDDDVDDEEDKEEEEEDEEEEDDDDDDDCAEDDDDEEDEEEEEEEEEDLKRGEVIRKELLNWFLQNP
ncbi:hypothetical protein TKK_0009457 [Trichogramma kaykai]